MEPVKPRVIIPVPKVKLHWAHLTCEPCAAPCEGTEVQGYACTVCGQVYPGRTEYVETTVHYLQ